jgi:hypothetical protein
LVKKPGPRFACPAEKEKREGKVSEAVAVAVAVAAASDWMEDFGLN